MAYGPLKAMFLCFALLSLALAKPHQMPKMPQGIPGMGGGFAKRGPPWRKTTEKVFNEACEMNKGQPSVFCYPDVKELVEGGDDCRTT